jgi:hypothetical protein
MRIRNTPIFGAGIYRSSFLYPIALAASILLSACAGPLATQAQNPKPPKREYTVYRIDDHRYINIESRYPCTNGQLDGEIYYYDTRQNIRTPVAYTGDADNGLYLGYYAIHGDSSYVAIPSLSFSQTSGMMLHINYSHDGGRTFQGFSGGADGGDSDVVILNDSNLFIASKSPKYPGDYSGDPGVLYSINQDMDRDVAYSAASPTAFDTYGRNVRRDQVPFSLESPSGATRWICPSSAEN